MAELKRGYTPPELRVQDTRQIQGGQVVGPGQTFGGRTIGDDSWRDRMLIQLGNKVAGDLESMADVQLQNQYLEGQAAAGVVQSEEELQGDVLTRDWKVAGYRDAMGKLKLADKEAEFMKDLPKLREQSPAELNSYLTEQRKKILPDVAGMSRKARADTMGQMLMQERSAIKTHGVEHSKFIVEQRVSSITQRSTPSMLALQKAQDLAYSMPDSKEAGQAHLEAIRSTASMIVAAGRDEALPPTVRRDVVTGLIKQALAQDSVNLYDYFQQNKLAGSDRTLLSELSGEQQLMLSVDRREADTRTKDRRSFDAVVGLAKVEEQLKANSFTGSAHQLQGVLREHITNKTISSGKVEELMGLYYRQKYSEEQDDALVTAFTTGDDSALRQMDKSQRDGAQALQRRMTKMGMPPEQQVQQWLAVGSKGFQEGYKVLGEMMQVSLGALRVDGPVLPQHKMVFEEMNKSLRNMTGQAKEHARMSMLSGLKSDDVMFVTRLIDSVDKNKTWEEAITHARAQEVSENSMSSAAKAGAGTGLHRKALDLVAEEEANGIFETSWQWVKSLLPTAGGKEAASNLKNRPFSGMSNASGIFEDTENVQFYTQTYKEALTRQVNKRVFENPLADPQQLVRAAKADIAALTIKTEYGPVFLPVGTDIEKTFGVRPGNQSQISAALDVMFKPTKDGSRFRLQFSEGRLLAHEYDRNGAAIGGKVVDMPEVVREIKRQSDEQQVKAENRHGGGRTTKSADGVSVRFNGLNTAGVPADWAYDFRKNLVSHEGIVSKAHVDLSGKKNKDGTPVMSVGVGISSENPRFPKAGPDGRVTEADVQLSFGQASNDAVIAGATYARQNGMYTKAGVLLLSELSYHSGEHFLTQTNKPTVRAEYDTFMAAMKKKDVTAAQTAFKETAAYRFSARGGTGVRQGPDAVQTARQKNYLKLIEETIKGM